MEQLTEPIKGRNLYLLSTLTFAIAIFVGLKAGMLLGFGLMLFLLVSCGVFVYTLNKPHLILIITVYGTYLGIWGKLIPEAKLPLTLFQLLLFFTFFIYFLYKLQHADLTIRFYRQFIWISLFVGLLFISSLYSQGLHRWFFRMLLVICGMLSLYSIYQFNMDPQFMVFNAIPGVSKFFGRQTGSWADPNEFGILLVFPLLYLLGEIFIKKRSLRRFVVETPYHFILFFLILTALLTTYSRSSWLSLFVGTISLFLISRRIKKLLLLSVLAFGVILILSIKILFFQAIVNRLLSIADVSLYVSNTSRIVLADAGLRMFTDSYFLGFGYRSFRALAPFYFDLTRTIGVIAPHNITIALLAEVGILGLVLFYGMTMSFFREGYKSFKSDQTDDDTKIYLLTFLSYLISLLTFYQFYPGGLHNNMMWFCFGAILSIKAVLNGNRIPENPS
jgi:O-antigen ligase